MSALSPAIFESIEISAETTNGSGKTIELNLGVVKINIFEDLFSPTITAQVLVVSSGGAVPTLQVMVKEKLNQIQWIRFIVDYQYVVVKE